MLFGTDGGGRLGGAFRDSTRMQMAYLAVNDSESDYMARQTRGEGGCMICIFFLITRAVFGHLISPVKTSLAGACPLMMDTETHDLHYI